MTWWEQLMRVLERPPAEDGPPPRVADLDLAADPDTRLFTAERALDYYEAELARLRAERRWERRLYHGDIPVVRDDNDAG